MSCKEMKAKLLLVMERLGFTTVDDFVNFVSRDGPQKDRFRKVVVQNWFNKENLDLWGESMDRFLRFCARHDIPFAQSDFFSTADEYAKKVEAMSRPIPVTVSTTSSIEPTDARHLIGQYQIVRPYVGPSKTYVLEAMEIDMHEGRLRHLLVSHNRRDQKFLYRGYPEVEPRYYFALVSRPHEEFDHAKAHRCVTFYTENLDASDSIGCLSGVMLRGVAGGRGRFATALPFIAIRVPKCASLEAMKQVKITNTDEEAKPLYRTHPDSHMLIGEVKEHWFKPVFDICHAVFSDDNFLHGTSNATKPPDNVTPPNSAPIVLGDLVLKTVGTDVLQDIRILRQKKWVEAVDKIVADAN